MNPKDGEASSNANNQTPQPPYLSCTKCFDALWFCYYQVRQFTCYSIDITETRSSSCYSCASAVTVQQYYRYGEFDNCFGKWNALFDCLTLKTKKSSEVQEILEAREKAKPHIWTYRTVEEVSVNWWNMYNRFYKPPPQSDS